MKKRLFFIVEQLNLAGSAEYLSVMMANHLSEEYDVFLYSISVIKKNKVHPSFEVSSRVRIKSLNLPENIDERINVFIAQKDAIRSSFEATNYGEDIYFIFAKFDVNLLPENSKKIWVDGFEDVDDYHHYDATIFFSHNMMNKVSEKYPDLQNRFVYLNPCARFNSSEDFKFHGNHLFAITKLNDSSYCDLLINLVKELINEELKFHLTIACHGVYKSYLQKSIKANKIDRYVELISFDEFQEGLKNADLLIYTSKSKFLPTTLVEAIVNSVPVICCSDNEYAKELIQDNGIILQDNSELISTIINVLKDKIKLSKMKFETYETSKRFSRKESLTALVNFLSEMDE